MNHDTTTPPETVDQRLVFLERASARLQLVYSGDMDLSEAIEGLRPAWQSLGSAATRVVKRVAA